LLVAPDLTWLAMATRPGTQGEDAGWFHQALEGGQGRIDLVADARVEARPAAA
jgi:hypothetical protein